MKDIDIQMKNKQMTNESLDNMINDIFKDYADKKKKVGPKKPWKIPRVGSSPWKKVDPDEYDSLPDEIDIDDVIEELDDIEPDPDPPHVQKEKKDDVNKLKKIIEGQEERINDLEQELAELIEKVGPIIEEVEKAKKEKRMPFAEGYIQQDLPPTVREALAGTNS